MITRRGKKELKIMPIEEIIEGLESLTDNQALEPEERVVAGNAAKIIKSLVNANTALADALTGIRAILRGLK